MSTKHAHCALVNNVVHGLVGFNESFSIKNLSKNDFFETTFSFQRNVVISKRF